MTGEVNNEIKGNVRESFKQFLDEFYEERIKDLKSHYEEGDVPSLTIDYRKVVSFDENLAKGMSKRPDLFYANARNALRDYLDSDYLDEADLRIENHGSEPRNVVDIREIRSKHSNQMITVDGIIKQASSVLPRVTKARFTCRACGTSQSVPQPVSPDSIEYPFECSGEGCTEGSKNSFNLDKRNSSQVDFQKITIEEAPEELKGGENPESVDCYIKGDITGEATPGDRVSITGILRLDDRNDSPVLSHFTEGNTIEQEEQDFEEIEITDEEEERILEMSNDPDIFDKIIQSIAPDIFGYDRQKEAVAVQLFSGVSKNSHSSKIRGDIHILIVGDPGTGKSEIIESAKELAPRGVYTVGKGSSAAGLTASAVRTSDISGGQQWTLEAGALVLADKGLACVDEIDKMRDEDRSALHEALEQQSYHRDTEILLANGERRAMGDVVDELMENQSEDVVDAVNCEILDTDDGEIRLHTVDLESGGHEKIDVDRVSRHEAPDQMVEVTFSNGRTVTVTPEHPLYTTENGEISVVDATNAEEGMFAPAPERLPNSTKPVSLETNTSGRSTGVTVPNQLNGLVAELLGHLTAEGHSYDGESGYTIGYTNSNEENLSRVRHLFNTLFGDIDVNYNQSGESAPTLRINSKKVYTWFEDNHPEVLNKAGGKRIPASVLGSSSENIRKFLVGVYTGDGGVESTAISISTKSKGLSEDYADAMLKIGVSSRIVEYETNNSTHYKTIVKGDSDEEFVEQVVAPSETLVEEVESLTYTDSSTHHDVLPTDFVCKIRSLRKSVGLTNDGSLKNNIENDYGIEKTNAQSHLDEIESRVSKIIGSVSSVSSFTELRELTGWSQRQLAEVSGMTTSSINYIENENGYTPKRQSKELEACKNAVQEEVESVRDTVDRIGSLMNLRFERITDVNTVENTGEGSTDWVYDLTVEPTRTFVGKGMVLHNTISVNKAGINATLKSRCSLLAAANPKFGRFDGYEPIGEQIDMQPALISRFDLIFTVTDEPDSERDKKIADHILDINEEAADNDTDSSDEDSVFSETLEPDLLRKYIAYARQNYNPVVRGEQKKEIRDFYVNLRNKGDEESPVSVTAREVPSTIRLAEAIARMRLGTSVNESDIQRAIDLKTASISEVGVDPETGEMDADMVAGDTSTSQRKQVRGIEEMMKNMIADNEEYDKNGIPLDDIKNRAQEVLDISESKLDHRINKMQQKGNLLEPTRQRYRPI
jgi:replicative DNA helicase Mcm